MAETGCWGARRTQVRNVRSLDEKLVERAKPGCHPGKLMILVSGPVCESCSLGFERYKYLLYKQYHATLPACLLAQ